MSTTNPNRNPKGQPTGGQFAAKSNPESEVELADQLQPVVTVEPNGTQVWRLNGQLHRDDGPAIAYPDGHQAWYQNGQRHRTDGPAVIRSDGTQEWYQNGRFQRLGGPAVTYSVGHPLDSPSSTEI